MTMPLVEQIESDYRKAKTSAKIEYDETKEQLNNKYNSEINRLAHDYEQQAGKIAKTTMNERTFIKTRAKGQKETAEDSIEGQLAHHRENYEYEIMVADIVEKGSLQKNQKNLADIQASVSSAKSELSGFRNNLRRVLFSLRP